MNHMTLFSRVGLRLLIALVLPLLAARAGAQIIVDGVNDQGFPPFRTITAAIGYAINHATDERVIEIQTNTPEGRIVLNNYDAPDGFTIRAGQGFTPVIDGGAEIAALIINTSDTNRVTLEGLTLRSAASSTVLDIGALTLRNCTISNTGSASSACVYTGGAWGVAGAGLVIEDCQLTGGAAGVDGVEFNTGIDSLTISGSTIEVNGDDGLAIRHRGLHGTPRPLTVSNSVLKCANGWSSVLVASDPNVGDWTLTNCVFMINALVQQPVSIYWGPPTKIEMRHCTWRASDTSVPNNTILMRLTTDASVSKPKVLVLTNCLFDFPFSNMHSVVFTDDAGLSLTGDANAYNIGSGKPYRAWLDNVDEIMPTFESSRSYTNTGAADGAFITDATAHLTSASTFAFARAVTLTPAVTEDLDGDARPQPAGASAADVGADEFNEGGAPVTASRHWDLLQ